MSYNFRRKHQGKLTLFSEKVKSKPHSRFVIHATSLHGGQVDTSNGANEEGDEKLEMKTFGKSDTVSCKGIQGDDFNLLPQCASLLFYQLR